MMIPHFQLYGEDDSFADPGFVHIETVASRSRENGWEIKPHSHETLDQLLVIRSGRVQVRLEHETLDLQGPATIMVPACAVHGFRFDDDVVGDVLTFSAELLQNLMAGFPGPSVLAPRPLASRINAGIFKRIDPLLDEMRMECSGHAEGRIAASAWLVGLLILQIYRVVGSNVDPMGNDGRLNLFRQLVDEHFREHRPIAFYADALGMTERTLARLTQARLGCAPAQFLRRRLLLEAQRQLVYGGQSIASIATDLGFYDPSYFTRFYRRMTSELPSSLRKM